MLSMPPATMTSALPASRASRAIITACRPEPHILLTVVASTCWPGRRRSPPDAPGPGPGRRAGRSPCRSARPCRRTTPGALDRGLHRRGAQLGGLDAGQRALEAAHGRAGEGDDDDGIGHGGDLGEVRKIRRVNAPRCDGRRKRSDYCGVIGPRRAYRRSSCGWPGPGRTRAGGRAGPASGVRIRCGPACSAAQRRLRLHPLQPGGQARPAVGIDVRPAPPAH